MKPKLPKKAGVPLALDSGAHALYNEHFSARTEEGTQMSGLKAIGMSDYKYVHSEGFRKYLDGYMEYLTKYQHLFEFTVTLDIIFNPEASWETYKELRDSGFKVMPVYHFGEDIKWLKKYMDDSDYVGIGGLGQQTTKSSYIPFGDRAWRLVCDSKGRPKVKCHGFAMSSFDLMLRWPWYSVDSTSAFTFSRMGAIMLPQTSGTGHNFSVTPFIFPVADGRSTHQKHIGHNTPDGHIRRALLRYIDLLGLTEEDVSTHYVPRDICNLYFMNSLMKDLSLTHSRRMDNEHSLFYYASGNPTHSQGGGLAMFEYLQERDALTNIRYLGTYYQGQRNTINFFLRSWHGVNPK